MPVPGRRATLRLEVLPFILACLLASPPSRGAGGPGGPPVPAPGGESTLVREAARDVWLSSVDGEQDFNMGSATKLKLKQWQEFALVDFDLSDLAGRLVTRAELVVTPVGPARLGLNAGSDLRWLSVSTVSHDWVEGRSRRYGRDEAGGGATFLESSSGRRDWGWAGARVWDVILGNGNTLRFDGRLVPSSSSRHGGRALRIQIDPSLVRAMIAGASHGLLLMDGSTDVHTNAFIASRESGRGPYLELEVEPSRIDPAQPIGLEVTPAPGRATPRFGAVEIALTVPDRAFAWDVTIDGRPVERWQVPFAGAPGTRQSFPLLDLEPDREVRVEVVAVSADGSRSPPVRAVSRTSSVLRTTPVPASPFHPLGGPPPKLGKATVWALPELTRIDAIDGRVLGEARTVTSDLRRRNAVWDGAGRTVRLAAARGEIVSFQIVVEGALDRGEVRLTPLTGGADGRATIGADHLRLWRWWYVGSSPEYALPLVGALRVPEPDNEVAGQTVQALTVDVHVPPGAEHGRYRGEVSISRRTGATSNEETLVLDLELQVYDVTLPDTIGFDVELNTYRGPGPAGSPRFKESFRLAHYHRATINRVPYTHRGDVHPDWAPRIDASGRIVDWTGFDRRLGGLLDGSWFADNPRAGVPVPVLYLPIFEGWPLDFRRHYHPGEGVPVDAVDPLAKLRHDTLAPPLVEALDTTFKDAFRSSVRSFADHIADKGWDRTVFEVYFNNKPRYGYTMWTLDEPFEYLDWAALATFARMTHDALAPSGPMPSGRRPPIAFRVDTSRPMWMGTLGDGLFDALYVGSDVLPMRRLLGSIVRRTPTRLYAYGTPPSVGAGGWSAAAWCLEAWASYADGVLPWQSIAGAEALERPIDTALLIDGGERGRAIASLRLHSLRRGAQLVELLRLLERRRGWSREQTAHLVAVTLGRGRPLPRDAAWRSDDSLDAADFELLREGVLQLLTADVAASP